MKVKNILIVLVIIGAILGTTFVQAGGVITKPPVKKGPPAKPQKPPKPASPSKKTP